jgi:hypothetical protein
MYDDCFAGYGCIQHQQQQQHVMRYDGNDCFHHYQASSNDVERNETRLAPGSQSLALTYHLSGIQGLLHARMYVSSEAITH